jgi:hypothetical protein
VSRAEGRMLIHEMRDNHDAARVVGGKRLL